VRVERISASDATEVSSVAVEMEREATVSAVVLTRVKQTRGARKLNLSSSSEIGESSKLAASKRGGAAGGGSREEARGEEGTEADLMRIGIDDEFER